jgi:hypothetical protein
LALVRSEKRRRADEVQLGKKLFYQVDEDWFAFGPPAFQVEISGRMGRGEKPSAS